jgi:hypothetical protein
MIKQSAQSENLLLKPEVDTLLVKLGVESISYAGGTLVAKTPITGETVAHVREINAAGTTSAIQKARAARLPIAVQVAHPRASLTHLSELSTTPGIETGRRKGVHFKRETQTPEISSQAMTPST